MDKPVPTHLVVNSLKGAIGAVYRHAWPNTKRSYDAKPRFLCFATHLGGGMFATIADGGVEQIWGEQPTPLHQNGVRSQRIDGESVGSLTANGLRIHMLDGSNRVHWVKWAYDLPIQPVVLLQTMGSDAETAYPTPEFAPASGLIGQYPKLWRISYAERLRNHGGDPSREPRFHEGCVFDPIIRTLFRSGDSYLYADKSTTAFEGDLDYPVHGDYGCPVVDLDGRLVGVIIGGNNGPERSHVGVVVHVQQLAPHIEICRAIWDDEGEKDRRLMIVRHIYNGDEPAGWYRPRR